MKVSMPHAAGGRLQRDVHYLSGENWMGVSMPHAAGGRLQRENSS